MKSIIGVHFWERQIRLSICDEESVSTAALDLPSDIKRLNVIANDFALKKAFEITCQYRRTPFEKEEALLVLEEISNSDILRTRWKNYAKKSSFAKDLTFETTMKSCKEILDCIF